MKKTIMMCAECRKEYEEAGIPAKKKGNAMETMSTCAVCRKRRLCKLTEVGR